MKKSGVGFAFIATTLMLSMIGLASAQSFGDQVVRFVDGTVKAIEPIAKYLLGDSVGTATFSAGELLFAKVLFLLLVFSIIFLALSNIDFFSYRTWALWIISAGAAVLSTRFLGNDIVPAILIPYSALGFLIAAGLPLVIAFFVIERGIAGPGRETARRVAWIFFAVIFIGLWVARGFNAGNSAAWVYPITAAIALVMMWMDGTIQGFFNTMTFEKASAMRRGPALAAMDSLITQVHDGFTHDGAAYYQHYPANPAVTGVAAYKHDLKELEDRRKYLLKS